MLKAKLSTEACEYLENLVKNRFLDTKIENINLKLKIYGYDPTLVEKIQELQNLKGDT